MSRTRRRGETMKKAAETAPPPQLACYIVRGSAARPFGISTG